MTKTLFPGIATLQWEKVCNLEKIKGRKRDILRAKKSLIRDLGSFILYNNHMLTISIDLHC